MESSQGGTYPSCLPDYSKACKYNIRNLVWFFMNRETDGVFV